VDHCKEGLDLGISIAQPLSDDEVTKQVTAFEETTLPKSLHGLLQRRDGAALLVKGLQNIYKPAVVTTDTYEQQVWQAVGNFYKNQFPPRTHEALGILAALYDHMLAYEIESGKRCGKGMPLVWMADC
jgi:hypothetical protein